MRQKCAKCAKEDLYDYASVMPQTPHDLERHHKGLKGNMTSVAFKRGHKGAKGIIEWNTGKCPIRLIKGSNGSSRS